MKAEEGRFIYVVHFSELVAIQIALHKTLIQLKTENKAIQQYIQSVVECN